MKTGGYRVTPEEVEASLRPWVPHLPFVVLGLPSDYWGEIVTAVAEGDDDEWHAALAGHLSGMTAYKRPRLFACLPVLPRNAMGKLVRARVRDEILLRYTLTDGPHPSLVASKVEEESD